MDKNIILIIIFLLNIYIVTASTTYILTPIDDVYIDNVSFGTKGNKYLNFNLSTVRQEYTDKNMSFVSSELQLYYYVIGKAWNDMPLYTKDPTDVCWNETMNCSLFHPCRGTTSVNTISVQSLVKDDFKYYSWNASGTKDFTKPGVRWHLDNYDNISFYLPFGAQEYTCETIYNTDTLHAEDNSGKDADAWSNTGTFTPLLYITLQDPKEIITKLILGSTNKFIKFNSNRYIILR